MAREIGDTAVLKLVDRLMAVLNSEADGVRQQQAIEILMASHALRAGGEDSSFVLDGMAKHALQIVAALR